MAITKEEILSKLGRRYRTKVVEGYAKDNWEAAKSAMKSAFDALPFNSRIKAAYKSAIDKAVYDPKDWWAEKLVKNYERKMF